MNGTKCRLCQCLVDKQTGFSCSLKDDGFQSMIKTVFPFPISPVFTVARKTYKMDVLVCFQCSTAIRNFYNFSRQVEVIQTNLQAEFMGKDDSLSIDELHHLKTELVHNINETDQDTTVMSANIEDSECNSPIPYDSSRSAGNYKVLSEISDYQMEEHIEEEVIEASDTAVTCVDKTEVMQTIAKMEKRICIVTGKLDVALRKIPKTHVRSTRPFDFQPIENKEQLDELENKLSNEEFKRDFYECVSQNTFELIRTNRLYEGLNNIFTKSFLCSCSWTGMGRTKPKIPMKEYKHIIDLFIHIGSTARERANISHIEDFFKIILKNAKGRMSNMGVRKSTQRNWKRKMLNYPL